MYGVSWGSSVTEVEMATDDGFEDCGNEMVIEGGMEDLSRCNQMNSSSSSSSSSSAEEGNFRFDDRDHKIIKVPGDGSCLFNCIEWFRSGRRTDSDKAMRAGVINWMRSNIDIRLGGTQGDPTLAESISWRYGGMLPEQYFALKSRPNEWADELELGAYANWQNVNVHVFKPSERQSHAFRLHCVYASPTEGCPTHEMVFVNGNHYNVLLRKQVIEANLTLQGGSHYHNSWFRQAFIDNGGFVAACAPKSPPKSRAHVDRRREANKRYAANKKALADLAKTDNGASPDHEQDKKRLKLADKTKRNTSSHQSSRNLRLPEKAAADKLKNSTAKKSVRALESSAVSSARKKARNAVDRQARVVVQAAGVVAAVDAEAERVRIRRTMTPMHNWLTPNASLCNPYYKSEHFAESHNKYDWEKAQDSYLFAYRKAKPGQAPYQSLELQWNYQCQLCGSRSLNTESAAFRGKCCKKDYFRQEDIARYFDPFSPM